MATKKIEEIRTHSLFEGLFTINDELLAKIEQNMRDDNYDESQPIILATWEGQEEGVCIDGHTRLRAATNAGIKEVTVHSYDFETEEDAFEYAIRLQSNRRNLSDGDLIQCIERLHQRRPRGGDRRSEEAKESAPQSCGKKKGRSAAAMQTAEMLNICPRKVEQALTVINYGSPEVKEAVLKGEMSINRAYQRTQKERKQAEAELSAQNSGQQASEEGQEVEQADEGLISKFHASVFISMEHLGALHELGGSVEDHVASAVELYLKFLGERHEDIPAEKDQEHVKDDEEDDEACDSDETSAEESNHEDSIDDDEEEYLDLDEYGDE